jgi:hypothetical protein
VTTTAYVGGLSWTLVDASAGEHRSGPLVTTTPELLHTEEVTGSIPVSPTHVRGLILDLVVKHPSCDSDSLIWPHLVA